MSRPGVIFDLDGTLIDSETVYQEADREFVARYGVFLTDEDIAEFVGLEGREIVRRLKLAHNLPGTEEELLKEKNSVFLRAARISVRAFSATIRLADLLIQRGYPLAIATATPVDLREKMVELCGLAERFPIRVSAEEVRLGKPAPDVFLEAAARLEAEPAHCFVIEDSQYGVIGAKAAGMHVIAVPTDIASAAFADVEYVVPGGADKLDPELALSWIEGAIPIEVTWTENASRR